MRRRLLHIPTRKPIPQRDSIHQSLIRRDVDGARVKGVRDEDIISAWHPRTQKIASQLCVFVLPKLVYMDLDIAAELMPPGRTMQVTEETGGCA